MKHKINRKASVNGIKKIWVFDELSNVDEEERDHYHINCKEHPGFIVKKKYLKVDIDGNGVYMNKKDFAGTIIFNGMFEKIMNMILNIKK